MDLINSPSQAPSTSMQHAAQRHRDNLDDYRRDFLRTRVSRVVWVNGADGWRLIGFWGVV
jgi:hypothetical protein